MGNRISIQFVNGDEKSPVLFSHWGGQAFANEAKSYAKALVKEGFKETIPYPLYRLEPATVMVDFIRHVTHNQQRVGSNLYLGVDEFDGDNSDNGHIIIDLRRIYSDEFDGDNIDLGRIYSEEELVDIASTCCGNCEDNA